ncbi:P-loop containing nucleoside triphosphate hydrolase protein [Morchella conica CCBAS932]|uniref:P-loop containing nucleoside triphosphate hydrolase protein n=1 Tax=Morchella conica CCBAS932 TaxID=1392247 RepID=A0A3N4KPJ0_9PEZI|nr:P-loop containing nucleoside triphosphate hydrolase protein [Morchella conica CCBAS932]
MIPTRPQRQDIEYDEYDDEDHRNHSWSSLFAFTNRKHILPLTAAVFFALLNGLVIPATAIILGRLFNAFATFGADLIPANELVDQVRVFAVQLVALGTASWCLGGAFYASWGVFGELQAEGARESLFEGLVDKDMQWYDMRRNGVAGLLARVQTQTKELQTAVSQPLGLSLQALVTAAVCLFVSITTCWPLTLVVLMGVPLAFIFLSVISRRIQTQIDTQKEHLSRATRIVNRAFTAIETVKAFNGQQYERYMFSLAAEKAARAYREQAHSNALVVGFIRLVILTMFVQGFWYGGHLIRQGEASVGDVMTTFWSCLMATQALSMVLPQMIVLEKGKAAGAGLDALLGGIIPKSCQGEIEVKSVSFAYPSRPCNLALNGASIFIPSHETTFIVGKSGSGKSTLGNLILKTYMPLSGTITLDGTSVQDIDQEWLRSNVTIVQQESVLFNETIFRNIAFGRKDYKSTTREEVHQSCRMSMLEETLRNFPLGSNTIVGAGGAALSGGQRQRVALARAILRNTPILILDEATSALDYVSRSLVMEAIHTWRRGKTTIIITHDISQIKPQDFVYVLENGEIVQNGYRSEICSVDGLFRDFVKAYDTNKEIRNQPGSPRIGLVRNDRAQELIASDVYNEGYPVNGTLAPISEESSTEQDQDGEFLDGTKESTFKLENLSLLGRAKTSSPKRTRRKLRVRLLERRLNTEMTRFDYVPAHSPTYDIGSIIPETPRKQPVRRFEAKQITLLQIFSTIWPSLNVGYRFLLVTGFTAAFFHASATPAFSYALARLLSSFFKDGNLPSESARWSVVILCIAVIDATSSYLMHYFLESVAQSWIDTLRIKSLARILDQPRVWFDENLVATVTEDMEKNAEDMRDLLGRFAGYVFIGATIMILGVGWSFTESWQLTMVGLSIAPVMYGLTRTFAWISDEWEKNSNEAAEIVGCVFDETITNIKTVRGLALERYFKRKYAKATRAALRIGVKRSVYTGVGYGLSDSAVSFATALIFWYGAVLIGKGLYDIQHVLTVFSLLLFSLAGANTIVGFVPQISNSKDTARRVLRLYTLPRSSHEIEGSRTLDFRGAISFSNVTFAYPTRPDTIVLRNFNLKVSAGECIAIVGLSGSGKSTVAALLQRLYPYSAGSITIDTLPIESLSIRSLRSQMAIVSQSAVLFDSSVHDNISYGSNYTRCEVERAAKAAGIHEFVKGLQDGYDTYLGDKGGHISGGQAQMIGIARALVRRPAVLVLDECTSNLDPESAMVIHNTIGRLVDKGGAYDKKMTVIIITHSQEMMRCAEKVVVMSHGEVVESGKLEELLERRGELHRLLNKEEWVKSNGHDGST